MRWAWAEVDLGAIEHNVRLIRDRVAPAQLWAVVKANAYGHGAVQVARAALRAGAQGLCVALVQEGVELRADGIDAPILVLTEQPGDELDALVKQRLIATVYSTNAVQALARAVRIAGAPPLSVHVKIDTGMHRAGGSPENAGAVIAAVQACPELVLAGVFTHLAVADEPAHPANTRQLATFTSVIDALGASVATARLHAANSAGTLAISAARFDLVRVGIAMYGIVPGAGVAGLCAGLRPAMSLHTRISLIRRLGAGESLSYGLRHTFDRDTTVATVPIGYADGVPRRLFAVGGEVLVHGRRHSIVGAVTMDQLMIDCGDSPVTAGDDVVLLGTQEGRDGTDSITAAHWAMLLDTIPYEIVCGISSRIERRTRR